MDWKHICQECGRGFPNKHGLAVHKGRHCKKQHTEEYEIDKVLDVRGPPDNRLYQVSWKGWSAEHNTWEHWRQCMGCLDAVDDFWEQSGLDKTRKVWLDCEDNIRCKDCCRLFRRPQDLKTHHSKMACKHREASRAGSKAEKTVHKQRRAAAKTAVCPCLAPAIRHRSRRCPHS